MVEFLPAMTIRLHLLEYDAVQIRMKILAIRCVIFKFWVIIGSKRDRRNFSGITMTLNHYIVIICMCRRISIEM